MLLTSVVQYIKYILANKCPLCTPGCALHSLLTFLETDFKMDSFLPTSHFTVPQRTTQCILSECRTIVSVWRPEWRRDGMTWERVRVVRSSYNIGFMSTFYKGLQSSHHFSLDISVINLYRIWNKNFKSDNLMTHNQ